MSSHDIFYRLCGRLDINRLQPQRLSLPPALPQSKALSDGVPAQGTSTTTAAACERPQWCTNTYYVSTCVVIHIGTLGIRPGLTPNGPRWKASLWLSLLSAGSRRSLDGPRCQARPSRRPEGERALTGPLMSMGNCLNGPSDCLAGCLFWGAAGALQSRRSWQS